MSKRYYQIERKFDGDWEATVTPFTTREKVIDDAEFLARTDKEGKEYRVTTIVGNKKSIVHTTEVHSASN